jgi:hypothetical protein
VKPQDSKIDDDGAVHLADGAALVAGHVEVERQPKEWLESWVVPAMNRG